MKTNESESSVSTVQHLQECADTLGRIYATCCLTKRSPKMDDAFSSLQNALASAQAVGNDNVRINDCIEGIEDFGGKIGVLYATCCTEIREPMYQDIFRKLQQAQRDLSRE